MHHLLSVFRKDLRSELRTRSAMYSVLLFIVNSVILILFSVAGMSLSNELFSGLLWLVVLFSSSVGMAKSFVSEEERGTSLYLRFVATSDQVFNGKLLYNILLSGCMTAASVMLFAVVFEVVIIHDLGSFSLCMLTACLGVSVAMTTSAALISRAQTKSALLPILTFPLLLPILFVGVEATTMCVAGTPFHYIQSDLLIMLSYAVVLYIVSSWLFPFIWKD